MNIRHMFVIMLCRLVFMRVRMFHRWNVLTRMFMGVVLIIVAVFMFVILRRMEMQMVMLFV